MGTKTSNYKLIKPSQNDFYDIENQNTNMDIIDVQMKNIETEVSSHLSDTATITIHSRALISDLTVYVDSVNGNDTTGDGSGTKPYATIQKALSVVPKNLNGFQAVINIKAGDYYLNNYMINGYHGGLLSLWGTSKPLIHVTTRLDIRQCHYVYFNGVKFQGVASTGIVYVMDGKAQFYTCEFDNLENGVCAYEIAEVNLVSPVMNNNVKCLVTNYGSTIGVFGATGSNNNIAYSSACGGGIGASNCTMIGTTMYAKENGWILDGNVFK